MKILAGVILGAMVLSSSVFAAEEPKKPEWYSILECTDIKTGKLVVTEKSRGGPDFKSPTSAAIHDMSTGNYVYVFSMGADVICKFTDRETYEKRR